MQGSYRRALRLAAGNLVKAHLKWLGMVGWPSFEPYTSPLREVMEQVLAEHRRRAASGEPMPINVFEEDGTVVVDAALPGVSEDLIDLSCTDNVLTIRARHEVSEREFLHQEVRTTDFQRQIALPGDCRFERADASLENGVLTIRVPKVRPRAPDRIRIQVTKRSPTAHTIEAEPGSYTEVDGRPPSRQRGGD
ncbi:MAG: Hsp20/alpha crystallin family protein [Candidatus Dormiibacterota bacterium]